jgi:hypothetical protein
MHFNLTEKKQKLENFVEIEKHNRTESKIGIDKHYK